MSRRELLVRMVAGIAAVVLLLAGLLVLYIWSGWLYLVAVMLIYFGLFALWVARVYEENEEAARYQPIADDGEWPCGPRRAATPAPNGRRP